MPLSQEQSFLYASHPRAFSSNGARSFSPTGSSQSDNSTSGVNRTLLSQSQASHAALYYSSNNSDEENWLQSAGTRFEYYDSPDVLYHSDPDYNLSRRSPTVPSQPFSFTQSSLPRHYESPTGSPQRYESDSSFHSHQYLSGSRFQHSLSPAPHAGSHLYLPPCPNPSNFASHDPSPHLFDASHDISPFSTRLFTSHDPSPHLFDASHDPSPHNPSPHSAHLFDTSHDPSPHLFDASHNPSPHSAHLFDASHNPSDEEYRYPPSFFEPPPQRRFTPEIPMAFGNSPSLLDCGLTATPPKPRSMEATDWEGFGESAPRTPYRPISHEDAEPRLSRRATPKQLSLTDSSAKEDTSSEKGGMEHALCLKKAGRVAEAREALQRLLAKYPKSSAICFEIVRIDMDAGCFSEAQTLLSEFRLVNAEERVLERLLRVDERMGDAPAILRLASALTASNNYSSVKVTVEACIHLAKLCHDFVAQQLFTSLIDRGCLKQGNLATMYANFLFRSVGIDASLRALESGVRTFPKHGPLWFFHFYLLEHQELMLWDGASMTDRLRPTALLSCYAASLRSVSVEMRWKVFYVAIQMILRTLVHLRLVSPNQRERLAEYLENTRFGLEVYRWYFRNLVQLCPASLRWKCWLLAGRANMLSGNRRVASEVETHNRLKCSASRAAPSRASSGTRTRCSSRSRACSTSRATWRRARRCWRRA